MIFLGKYNRLKLRTENMDMKFVPAKNKCLESKSVQHAADKGRW